MEEWVENPYFQFFCGEVFFRWEFPCCPTDLVYFRKRIGKKEVQNILEVSIKFHGKKAREKEVLVDTTVQEKNITFPTDTKLHKKNSGEMCQDSQRGRDKAQADIQKDDNQTNEGPKIQKSSKELQKG